MTAAKGLPENSSILMPRLFCRDAHAEIEFCKSTFDAAEVTRRADANGRTVHALLTISTAMVMIESEWPQIPNRAPATDGSSPVVLFLYVQDVDDTVRRAALAGATVLQPPADQFWGDRTAWILDPSAHVWTIATRIEETTEEQRRSRLAAMQTKS